MNFSPWIYIVCTLFCIRNTLSYSLKRTENWKPQRRNSKAMRGFPDPRRPLKDIEKLDKFLRSQQMAKADNQSISNEILDELDAKIISGREAEPGEYPWMVALHRSGRFICSAFLVSPIYVATAAHCVEFEEGIEPAENFFGVLGTVDRTDTQKRVRFVEIVSHPDFGKGEMEGDMALMKLSEPVELSKWVQPICLPESGRDFELEYVQAMGWGITSNEASDAPEKLQTTELAAQPRSLCQLFFAFMLISITDRHICAAANTATGVCFGDSGGPLVLGDMQSGRPLAIGVASFVTILGCGRPLVPGVYTSTAAFSDWVKEMAGPDSGICFV